MRSRGLLDQGATMTGFQSKKASVAAKLNEDWINLREQVLNQIVKDVQDGDLTAIEELLVYCTEDAMRQYLPE
jgi:hypothetical protein